MSETLNSLKPLRQLGLLETFEAVRYVRGLFSNVATSAVYNNPASTHDLRTLVLCAVRQVIPRFPALSTVFLDAEDNAKKPYYARLPHIDLRDFVIFETRQEAAAAEISSEGDDDDHDNELDRLLERFHNTRFDENWGQRPLWKLIILQPHKPDSKDDAASQSFIACFIYQHTIADGNAGPAFHRALQAELSTLAKQQDLKEPNKIVPSSPEATLPPSLESLHKLPLSARYLLKMAWYDKFPRRSLSLWLGAPIPSIGSPPTRSRFRSFSLTAAASQALLAVCKAHAVTITAAVHALLAQAIFSNLPAEKTQLTSTFAIDLRRFLPAGALEGDTMGNYVSTTYLDHNRFEGTAAFWDEARRMKALMDKDIKSDGKDASTACLRWAGDMHKYFASKAGQPRDGSFCLTNLGRFHASLHDDGPWKIGRMVFSEAFDVAREAMDMTMVSGGDGCLTLGLVWGDGIVEDALVDGIFASLRTSMCALASSQQAA